MAVSDDIATAIGETAVGPKRVQVGNQSVDAQSVQDQIAAAEFLASQSARTNRALPFSLVKIRPGGAA